MNKTTRFLFAGVLLGALGLIVPQPAFAQGDRLITEAKMKEFEGLGTIPLKLVMGEVKPGGDAEKKAINLMAEYYILSMTLEELQNSGEVTVLRHKFEEWINQYVLYPKYKEKNKEFRDLFAQELTVAFKKVFAKDATGKMKCDIVSCVNAALMLPTYGRLPTVDGVDLLIGLIGDGSPHPLKWGSSLAALGAGPVGQGPLLVSGGFVPVRAYGEHDAIKLFAFKALQMCFLEPPPELNLDFGDKGFMDKDLEKDKKKRQQLANRLNPIINYILVPPYLASKPEANAYRFIRAEAIRTLAQISLPFVPETPGLQDKKKGKILAPVAYALMRVLVDGDDGLQPTPTLIEKVEAALGLCHINANAKLEEEKANQASRYNDELSVILVGDALVHYIKQYQNDPGASPLAKASAKLPPMLPWKIYSKLLLRGLDEFSKNLASAKAKQNLAKIVDNVKPDLEKIAAPGAWKDVGQPLGVMENLHSLTTTAPNPVVYQDTEYKITLAKIPLY